MRGGILAKARRGELALALPIGLAYDQHGQVVLDPDAGVRHAVRLLFDTFAATGSAFGVVRAFREQQLTFPARHRRGPRRGELFFQPLTHDRVIKTLHNPAYAGAYAYGRARHTTGLDGHHHTTVKPIAEWTVLIKDHHPGYLTWAQHEANLAVLTANAAARGDDRAAGPPREGTALLQGLAVCGRCGRRMTIRYHTRHGTQIPGYVCQNDGIRTAQPICQHLTGDIIDSAVSDLILTADGLGDPGAARDLADDPPGAVPVQPAPVFGEEDRPVAAFAGGQVDRPGSARGERDGDDLAALAGNGQGPVAALDAQVLDISAGGLRYPQPVQREQRDQRMLGRRAEPGGHQQRAQFVAVQGGGMGLVIQPRPPDMRGRGYGPGVPPRPRTCRTRRWCTACG